MRDFKKVPISLTKLYKIREFSSKIVNIHEILTKNREFVIIHAWLFPTCKNKKSKN
jgi:hypothetical protein